MKDVNGKTIKVGSFVQTPRGVFRVSALVQAHQLTHAGDAEVLSAREAAEHKAGDGDTIMWGS